MENCLWILCAVLTVVIAALCVKLRLMKKSADEIFSAFTDRLLSDTNTLIDISSRDRHMKKLADGINTQLRLLRDERRRFCCGDTELKEAVTNISHDLRTPLTAMSGYLDLLETEEKSENVKRYLDMIKNRAEVLKQLTDELFRYSIIVSVTQQTKELADIKGILEESLVSSYGAMQQKKISPNISLPEEKVERNIDRSAMSRVFGNIISNAIKYSDGDFSVTMETGGKIVFSNTARELNPVSVGRLFDRFYTVETGRSSTGLGLSIAKLLTERMGGTIAADYRDEKLYITVEFCESELNK